MRKIYKKGGNKKGHSLPSKEYRITGIKKVLLISIALVLDTLPIIGFIIGGALFGFGISGMYESRKEITQCVSGVSGSNSFTSLFWNTFSVMISPGKSIVCTGVHAPEALADASVGAGIFALAPIIYMTLSIFSLLLAVTIFPLLFAFFKYNMFGLGFKKTIGNLTSFVLKALPFLNAITPTITLNVLWHIHISKKEDEKGH
jgi:hypothetical protein